MRQSLSGTRAAKPHPTAWSRSLSDTVLSSRSIALERGPYTKVPTDPQPRQATQHAGRWRLHANRSYALRNSDHQQDRRNREPFDFSSIGSVGNRRYRTVRRPRKPVGDRIGMFWNGDISRRGSVAISTKTRGGRAESGGRLRHQRWPDGPVAMPWPRSQRTARHRRLVRRSAPRRRFHPG